MSEFDKETKYTFLPWFRIGLGTKISSNEQALRPKVSVELNLKRYDINNNEINETVTKDVFLYGPGDVEAILKNIVIRIEPKPNELNFEANYLPHIEFSQIDFPWRYTPTSSDSNSRSKLLPWICLIVLKEDEFDFSSTSSTDTQNRVLSKITLKKKPSDSLPDLQQSWAWAHCQITDEVNSIEKIKEMLTNQSHKCISRLMCPRHLEPNTKYFAFLVPSFEAGRLAGLGRIKDLNEGINNGIIKGTTFAWKNDETQISEQLLEIPVYYKWEFNTAGNTGGDFEALVRKLHPARELLSPEKLEKIGLRELDVSRPLAIDNDNDNTFGILKPLSLGGVLWSKEAREKASEKQIDVHTYSIANPTDPENPSAEEIKRFIMNLKEILDFPEKLTWSFAHNDDVTLTWSFVHNDDIIANADPIISPPIYGKWHAKKQIISKISDDNHQDPQWIKALLENDNNVLSEDDIQELLKLLNKLKENPPFPWLEELNLDPKNRVAAGLGTIVIQKLQEELMAAAWDQAGAIVEANRRLRLAQLSRTLSKNVFDRTLKIMNPDIMISTLAPFHSRIVINAEMPMAHEDTIANILHNSPIPKAFFSPSFRKITSRRGKIHRKLLGENNHLSSDLLKTFNKNMSNEDPSFDSKKYLKTIESLLPLEGINQEIFSTEKDFLNDEILNRNPDFKDIENTIPNSAESVIEELPNTIVAPLDKLHERLIEDLNPEYTINAKSLLEIHRPERAREEFKDKLDSIMAYPKFRRPMFEPLRDISLELLLPGAEGIPENTVSVLEVNTAFINSYMIGLNHEMSRELLWREYPTDQRGSYFRQFWDSSIAIERERLERLSSLGLKPEDNLPIDVEKEIIDKYQDIDEIHRWDKNIGISKSKPQGPNVPADEENSSAFLIKGDLMRRYPNSVIYAIRAVWYKNKPTLPTITHKDPNTNLPTRVFPNLQEEIIEPIFRGTINPDITFFGFSRSIDKLTGEIPSNGADPANEHIDGTNDKAGWFFVIQEQHSEPRFGIDQGSGDTLTDLPILDDWNNLSWDYVTLLLPSSNQHIDLEKGSLKDKEISGVKWGSHAADMANILLQLPVRIAIHASKMV